jgi:hypothetical protein
MVKQWGAAICTGFYFVRSNPRTIEIFRDTQARIVAKRAKQPKWQVRATGRRPLSIACRLHADCMLIAR